MNPTPLSDLLSTHSAGNTGTHWLIPDLLPIGLTLLHGSPRIGKSWLTLHLALSVALGTPALGTLPTTRTGVLYLGLQDTPQRFARRAHKLLGAQPAPDTFIWTDAPLPCLSTSNPIDTLDLWLTTHQHTRLLVIDSLNRLSSSSDTPGSSNSSSLLQPLKALVDKHHIAILVTNPCTTNTKRHTCNEHLSDPTSAIADTLMILKREHGQLDATLHLCSSDLPDTELALCLPPDTLTWTLLGPALDHRLSQERKDILAVLEEHRDGPLRPKDIAALLQKDPRAVTKLLFDMSRANQIRLLGRGLYMTIETHTPYHTLQAQTYAAHLEKLNQILTSNFSNDDNERNTNNDDNRTNGNNEYTSNNCNHPPTSPKSVEESPIISLPLTPSEIVEKSPIISLPTFINTAHHSNNSNQTPIDTNHPTHTPINNGHLGNNGNENPIIK